MATAREEQRIILDLQSVRTIDAAGLGLLVALHCQVQERQGTLTIENASPWVRKIMALTRLESVLQMARSTHPLTTDETSQRQAMTA